MPHTDSRRSLRTVSAALALAIGTAALVSPASPCDAIRNADKRNACYGRTRSNTDCESIRDSDRRATCRAEARR